MAVQLALVDSCDDRSWRVGCGQACGIGSTCSYMRRSMERYFVLAHRVGSPFRISQSDMSCMCMVTSEHRVTDHRVEEEGSTFFFWVVIGDR